MPMPATPHSKAITRAPNGDPTPERSSVAPLETVYAGDNLALMRSWPDGLCDLIYADPPFNTNRRHDSRRDGSAAFRDQYDGGLEGYLSFLEPRLVEMHRLLSQRGSLYVHLDVRTVHYVKVLLDRIFGSRHFLNEIIWSYRSGSRPGQWFPKKHDTVLLYARCKGQHTFHAQRGGSYRTQDLKFDANGTPYKSTRNGPLHFHADGPLLGDVWEIPFLSTVAHERTGYPTQKPERLLERIVQASTNPGDLVADFFCGSGTTLAVAKRLGRRWVGCDISPQAVAIARRRCDAVEEPGAA